MFSYASARQRDRNLRFLVKQQGNKIKKEISVDSGNKKFSIWQSSGIYHHVGS